MSTNNYRWYIRLFSFILILLLLSITQVSMAQGTDERIVFMSDRDGNREIYTMNPDGSDVERLTNNDAQDLQPAWSPDKHQIAFVSNRDGNFAIYVMNADGSNQKAVSTDQFAFHEYPTWSPDGQYLAYSSDKAGSFDIHIVRLDGSDSQRLTSEDTSETEPAWSPDGSTIAYLQQVEGAFQVFVMNTDGSNSIKLTQSESGEFFSPRWSPDGTQLAYALTVFDRSGKFSEIYVRDMSDGVENLLVSRPDSFVQGISWSTDGKTLVYQLQEVKAKWLIHRFNPATAELIVVTDQAFNSEMPSWSTPHMIGTLPTVIHSTPGLRINGSITATKLNVRTGPGPEYTEVLQLSFGASVSALGRNADATWVQIEGSAQGWVNVRFVQLDNLGALNNLPITYTEVGEWGPAETPTGLLATANEVLRIRGGPGANYRQLENPDTVKAGQTVNVVGRSRNGEWYKVNIDERSGWIRSGYVTLSGDLDAEIPVVSS